MVMQENHIFQGMARDVHPFNQKQEMLWDAHNIRISSREGNTLLSITNEQGTEDTGIKVSGECIGHCIVGKYLVLFTYKSTTIGINTTAVSSIYRIDKQGDKFRVINLYTTQLASIIGQSNARQTSLNFDSKYPIQALGVYETDLIQKVYWTDGNNMPRMINVAKPELLIQKESDQRKYLIDGVTLSPVRWPEDSAHPSYGEELKELFPNGLYYGTSFDFVRDVSIPEIKVDKIYGSGQFTPGVIQYAFTYFNKYEQESHVVYTTPLQYISHPSREDL